MAFLNGTSGRDTIVGTDDFFDQINAMEENDRVTGGFGFDNVLGGDLAASHLISRGCERIAFFGDPHALEIGQRLEGCRRAMARAGITLRQIRVIPDDEIFTDEDGLPIGVQIGAPLGEERRLISLGYELEEAMPWPRTPGMATA